MPSSAYSCVHAHLPQVQWVGRKWESQFYTFKGRDICVLSGPRTDAAVQCLTDPATDLLHARLPCPAPGQWAVQLQCCGLLLGNSLVLLCLLFLKIQNPKSTNLAGSLDGAPIHSTNSKTKMLSRDRSILQRFIHIVGIRCFLSIHRLQCDCDCNLRARCAAAVRSHNTTPPLRPRRGLIHLGGCHAVASEEQAQKKKTFGPRHVLATEA